MQGGIHPEYTGQHYLDVCRAVREAIPGMHVHAFSPLEVWHGATTLGLSLSDYLRRVVERAARRVTSPVTPGEFRNRK